MAGAKFQVKLYGHTSDDVESFSKKLAAILGISETEAMIIMHEVPLVVRDNLVKNAAENLNELLTSIRALSIVEPMDGITTEPVAQVAQPVAPALPESAAVPDEKDEFRFRLWTVLGVGLAGFLALFIFVGMIVSYLNLYETKPAKSTSPGKGTGVLGFIMPGIDEDDVAKMEAKVKNLRADYEDRREERDEANKDLYVADARLALPGEMELRRKRLSDAKIKMRAALKKLVAAQLELKRMKKVLSQEKSK